MIPAPHACIAAAVSTVIDAQQELADTIREACPGPHRFVQHRDRKPPWCGACGYAENGTRIKERP